MGREEEGHEEITGEEIQAKKFGKADELPSVSW